MKLPRPRNNERNATHVMDKSNVRMVQTKSGITRQIFVHGHGTCAGPMVITNYTDGTCRGGVISSTKQPASTGGRFVDCTPHNDCSLPFLANATGFDAPGFVWFLQY